MKKFFKRYAMTLVALGIASGSYTLMSFELAEKRNIQNDELWFLMNPAGTALTETQIDDPDAVCQHASSANCARAYDISQTEPKPGGGIRVKSTEVENYSDSRGKN